MSWTSQPVRALARRARTRGARWLGPLLARPAVGRAAARVFGERIPSRGLRVDTSSSQIAAVTKAALLFNTYESAEARFVQNRLRTDLDVLELGSSIGFLSALIRRRLSPRARLFCIEANPLLVEVIRTNVRLNAPGTHVQVIHRALGTSTHGTVSFDFGPTNDTGRTSDAGSSAAVHVAATSLPALATELALESFTLVADVEGAEAAFIVGDSDGLSHCEQLLIELHDTSWDGVSYGVAALAELLQTKHGFRLRDQYGRVFLFER